MATFCFRFLRILLLLIPLTPSIYSIFTCAAKVVLLVTRMPTFVTEYCSFSRPLTLFIPCSISLLLPSFTASA